MSRVAFFSVCNSKHFLGLVSLVNSIRRAGHLEPIFVTDCGLTERQRRILDPHVQVITPEIDVPPTTLKMYGPLLIAPELAVVLDADVILVRSFEGLLQGRPTFFVADVPDRRHECWKTLYPQQFPHPYVNAGHAILTHDFVARLSEATERMRELTNDDPSGHRTPADPFYYADQDALNALLGSVPPDQFELSWRAAYFPFRDGVEDAVLLHHIQPKPWLVPRPQTVFTREMMSLFVEGPIRPPVEEVPVRLRPGHLGAAARSWYVGRYHLRQHTRGKLGIRKRFGRQPGSRHFSGAVR
jgi:hypothetical protein